MIIHNNVPTKFQYYNKQFNKNKNLFWGREICGYILHLKKVHDPEKVKNLRCNYNLKYCKNFSGKRNL